MGNSAKAVILAEDECHQNLVYGWLRRRGLTPREIYMAPVPAPRGSGEQWVRERFMDQVAAIRQRRSRVKCWLYVLTDADTMTVEERLRALPSGDDDPVTRLVPRRHVETWVVALTSDLTVNEDDSYKDRRPEPAKCTDAGGQLAEARTALEKWPPSLKRGHADLQRSAEESGLFRA